MQRHQRQRHRMIWLVLGPLALVALIYAILNRPEIPVMEEVPGEQPSTRQGPN